MKEIVVISGKGGTGKTSLTASFAVLAQEEAVIADCDVDAADMHILLEPGKGSAEEFYSGTVAEVDTNRCIGCGKCLRACRFQALTEKPGGEIEVSPLNCEGCGYCSRVCPVEAIANVPQMVGHWYRSPIKTGADMVHARLGIGAENSGKLVAQVKNRAKEIAKEESKELVLVDGSPGVGCPVVSSLSGASFAVLVTEPTGSGWHDLKRVHQLVQRFGIPAGCLINKADLNPGVRDEIRRYCTEQDIRNLGELPYDSVFSKAMTEGRTIIEYEGGQGPFTDILKTAWKEMKNL